MIGRQDLKQSQSLSKVPALSILLPTYRSLPENRKDPIKVNNLVSKATERLTQEFFNRELEPLLQGLLEVSSTEIDHAHSLNGLALYVSHSFAKFYYLPFPVLLYVVIDQTFAGILTGNLDRVTIPELTSLVLPIIQFVCETQRADALKALCNAIGAQRVASTLGEAR
jgi:hypothetical protein